MANLIPDEVVEEIRTATDIVEVIADYVLLKKKGKNYLGLCPFHHERTPSFTVSGDKQIYRCFGCGAGGNVYTFLMEKEKMNFPEAVKYLAQRAGINIPEEKDFAEKNDSREPIYKINELAKSFFHYILKSLPVGVNAKKYFEKRGLTAEIVEKFQLGYAPPGWDGLINYFIKKGYSHQQLLEAGLIIARENKTGFYDRFRHRVMFPIWNPRGKVTAFGGRVLDDTLPKYLNSPETKLFNKSNTLYGLNFAIPGIRDKNYAIVMEGYLDVITAHQFGITNTVASLGTALTKDHGKILMRYTHNIITCFDADAAGIAATVRGLDILQELGFQVQVLSIPEGKDPDEFIRRQGPEAFLELAEKAKSLVDYKLEFILKKHDSNTVLGKMAVLEEIMPNLAKAGEVEKEAYFQTICIQLNLSRDAIAGELRKYLAKQGKNTEKPDKIVKNRNNILYNAWFQEETQYLKLILQKPELFQRINQEIGLDFFRFMPYRKILHAYSSQGAKAVYEPAWILTNIDDPDQADIISRLLMEEAPLDQVEIKLDNYIKRVKGLVTKDQQAQLLKKIADAEAKGDSKLANQLLQEYTALL